ncbi:unnamed protein product, partial [Mesorhabditis spiculigera]
MQKTFHEAMRNRRTSLPATSLSLSKTTPVTISNITEARGILVDLMAGKELPPNVLGCLRAVATLLTPSTPLPAAKDQKMTSEAQRVRDASKERRISHLLTLFPASLSTHHTDFGLPCVVENPYSGEQLLVSGTSKPRVSNITFSTVTSATGLPTIAAEPNRPRSSRSESYWKPETPSTNGPESIHDSASCHRLDVAASSNSVSAEDSTARVATENHVEVEEDRENEPCSSDAVYATGKVEFCPKEINEDPYWAQLPDWNFPIFDMYEKNKETCLSRLTYRIFQQADLFRIFRLNHQKFFNYFHALEQGYWNIPYHNRLHASDVLHGVYYLTCNSVHPQFGQGVPADSQDEACPPQPKSLRDSPAITVSETMSALELMALYTAAAMHDYDHPGRTNAFLVANEAPMAILYNDRSVLENHHAAESWKLLQDPDNFFLDTLDAAEIKRFRYLVLEYILATDLKQHFDIIISFNDRVSSSLDMNNEADRMLVSKLVIKLADINSPCKPYNLHLKWTERICEEFYMQGAEEEKRGITITAYMDRSNPQVAKLQDSFISHVVSPLSCCMNEAGLLPILPGLEEPEIMINLRHNHAKWLSEIVPEPEEEEELPEPQPEQEQDQQSCSSSGVGTGNGTIEVIKEECSPISESPEKLERATTSDESDQADAQGPELQIDFEMCTIPEEEYL